MQHAQVGGEAEHDYGTLGWVRRVSGLPFADEDVTYLGGADWRYEYHHLASGMYLVVLVRGGAVAEVDVAQVSTGETLIYCGDSGAEFLLRRLAGLLGGAS